MAVISSTGHIDDFTIEGLKNTSFPKLPEKRLEIPILEILPTDPTFAAYLHFAAEYKEYLYFIPTKRDLMVSKMLIDEGPKSHVVVPNSNNAPNSHLGLGRDHADLREVKISRGSI